MSDNSIINASRVVNHETPSIESEDKDFSQKTLEQWLAHERIYSLPYKENSRNVIIHLAKMSNNRNSEIILTNNCG